MIPSTSIEGEATYSDAMRVAKYQASAMVLCVGDGKGEEPKAFLVLTPELLEMWKRKMEGAE